MGITPAGGIALLIVGLFMFFIFVGWFFKIQIRKFVTEILHHREEQRLEMQEQEQGVDEETSTASTSTARLQVV